MDEAHGHVEKLRERFGPPSGESLTPAQAVAQETAWRAWRDLTRNMQNFVAQYANDTGKPRPDLEHEVCTKAGPATDTQR